MKKELPFLIRRHDGCEAKLCASACAAMGEEGRAGGFGAWAQVQGVGVRVRVRVGM